jgi:hypothetical protein
MLWGFIKNVAKEIKKGNLSVLKTIRHYPAWKRSLAANRSTILDEQPWVTFDATMLMENIVKEGFRVFEYGGGGSTLFFLKKKATVITVEHNRDWFNDLQQIISRKYNTGWKGELITAEPVADSSQLDISNPDHYYSDDIGFRNAIFKNYVSYIDQFPDHSFDIVMIDGRARTSCIKHAAAKVKKGGWFILDNAERAYYTAKQQDLLTQKFQLILRNFGAVPYSASFSATAIWKKI